VKQRKALLLLQSTSHYLQALTSDIQTFPGRADHRALASPLMPALPAKDAREAVASRLFEATGVTTVNSSAAPPAARVAPALAATAPPLSRHISSRLRSQAAAGLLGKDDAATPSAPGSRHASAHSCSHLRTPHHSSIAVTRGHASMFEVTDREHMGAVPRRSCATRPRRQDPKNVLEASMTDLAHSSRAARFASEDTLQPSPSALPLQAKHQDRLAGDLLNSAGQERAEMFAAASGEVTERKDAKPADRRLQEVEQRQACHALAACAPLTTKILQYSSILLECRCPVKSTPRTVGGPIH
jgi:hypothetical protein